MIADNMVYHRRRPARLRDAFGQEGRRAPVRSPWRLAAALAMVAAFAMADGLSSGVAQAANITPAPATLKDFNLHNLDATKLDSSTPVNLQPGRSDTWTVTITNGTGSAWTDFHVEVLGGLAALAADFTGVSATGFSLTSPANFKISTTGSGVGTQRSLADLGPSVTLGTVPNGNSITLTVNVSNTRVGIAADYWLGVKATRTAVPEPSSAALLLAGSSALWLAARRRRRTVTPA